MPATPNIGIFAEPSVRSELFAAQMREYTYTALLDAANASQAHLTTIKAVAGMHSVYFSYVGEDGKTVTGFSNAA